MIRYNDHTLAQYLEKLSAREPVPGGGSAAALAGALGISLIEMVVQYSLGKGKPAAAEVKLTVILQKAALTRARLLDLVSLDSEAYLKMREAKKVGPAQYKAAMKLAAAVPGEIKKLCTTALKDIAFLKKYGNTYLLSDVMAAEEFLKAGVNTANAMIKANQ